MGFYTLARRLTPSSIGDIQTGECQTISYHLTKPIKGIQSDNNTRPECRPCIFRRNVKRHKMNGRQAHILEAFISLWQIHCLRSALSKDPFLQLRQR